MPDQKADPALDGKQKAPFSEFEVTNRIKQLGREDTVTKGRFLFWGDVKSNDCPA